MAEQAARSLRFPFRANCKGMSAMPHREGDHIVETPTEARAGVTGHNVRYVLAAGTGALIVLFVGVYLYYFV